MSDNDKPNLLERGVAGLCGIVLWLSTTVIFAILVANTALRYTTGSSLGWANELPELLFPWLVMSGVVLAALRGAHIATVFLMEAVPDGVRRVVGVASWLAVAAMYATLSWATFRMLDIVQDETSPILHVPGSVTYGCVMVGMLLMAILALQSALKAARPLPLRDPGAEPEIQVPHW
jgi:TRAP-type C4-dicarboxylate transport system permease small subunit